VGTFEIYTGKRRIYPRHRVALPRYIGGPPLFRVTSRRQTNVRILPS